MSEFGNCRSCQATIRWAITNRNRAMPIDPVPVPDGNIRIRPNAATRGKDACDVLHGQSLASAQAGGEKLYKSHFSTCEHAGKWRRR